MIEETLSEKIMVYPDDYMDVDNKYINKKDIKEFIKKLKEECDKHDGYVDIDFINKLAGEELIGGGEDD